MLPASSLSMGAGTTGGGEPESPHDMTMLVVMMVPTTLMIAAMTTGCFQKAVVSSGDGSWADKAIECYRECRLAEWLRHS